MKNNLEDLTEEELKKLKQLAKTNYNLDEFKTFIKAFEQRGKSISKKYTIGKQHVKIGVLSDTHIGNINYDEDLMKFYARVTKKEKVDFHIHVGDIVDGWYQNRPHSIFEQNYVGFDRQINKAVEELKQLEAPLYFITGNHPYNTYVRGAGVEVGPYLEHLLNDIGLESHFLGNAEGNIEIQKNKIKLLHPDGGTAYAISYKSQKIAESFGGGEKPDILLIGHFHKMEYIFYRNISIFQAGTFENQTKFMRGKHISAHKGFWIIDLYNDSKGNLTEIIPKMYPAYS